MDTILLYNPSPSHESLAALPLCHSVQSRNRQLAAMEGPSTKIIPNECDKETEGIICSFVQFFQYA